MAHFDLLVLKEYPLWMLYLHSNQCYLGRAYAWLKRPGEMQRLSQLTQEETHELHREILPAYETALEYLWSPDHMNYTWLGNEFQQHQGHGHMHLIPRYRVPLAFGGMSFVDGRWGKNYAPYPKMYYADDELFLIRDTIRTALS